MSTEKMRHDFEQFIIRRDGAIWVTVMGDARSYNEPIERDFSVWCESRTAIEVKLPEEFPEDGHGEMVMMSHQVHAAIEATGLKVKP